MERFYSSNKTNSEHFVRDANLENWLQNILQILTRTYFDSY